MDGEAIVCDNSGLPVFELVLGRRTGTKAEYCAFDLLELDGRDLRYQPIESRKSLLTGLLRDTHPGIVLNQYFERMARMSFGKPASSVARGIVSKRLGSPYRSGRSPHWIKVKNPKAPAVKREAEEDLTIRVLCGPRLNENHYGDDSQRREYGLRRPHLCFFLGCYIVSLGALSA
jgi:ATP-dependent DNA ligase